MDKRNQFSLDAVHFLAETNLGEKFVFVDTSSETYPRTPPWRVPNSFENFGNPVQQMFGSLNLAYLDLKSFISEKGQANNNELDRLFKSCTSAVITGSKRTRPKKGRFSLSYFEKLEKKLLSRALRSLAASDKIIDQTRPDTIYIFNGRMSHQKAATIASEKKCSDIWFLETNMGKIVCRRYQPHDRVESQKHLAEVAKKLSKPEIESAVSAWLEGYSNSKGKHNIFAKPGSPFKGEDNLKSERFALFATSSRDEYESLEFDWDGSNWESQYEAFGAAWKHLNNRGMSPVLRIHPNLLNKHPVHVIAELREVSQFLRENPEFTVISAGSKTSTYDLLPSTDLVVVHNSTIGLEASIRGIPVVCTNVTSYDNLADVHKFFDRQDHVNLANIPIKSNPYGAMRWVAAQDFLDLEIPPLANRIVLEGYSRRKQIIRAFTDGSFVSVVAEQRWCFYRKVNRLIEFLMLAKR